MTAAYFSAAIPEPYRILGLQLKPLSLGRYRLMHRFDVAFVADEETLPGFQDLIVGVSICSMRCDDFLAWWGTKKFYRQMRKWSKRLCPGQWIGRIPWLGKWWMARHGVDVPEKLALFGKYISEGSEVPKFWDLTGGSSASGAHWAQAVEVILRGELGWTRDEINEEPLSKALSDYFKWMENKGLIQLMNENDLDLIRVLETAGGENGVRA